MLLKIGTGGFYAKAEIVIEVILSQIPLTYVRYTAGKRKPFPLTL